MTQEAIQSTGFDGLVAATRHFPNAMDATLLHGFLTAAVLGPEPLTDEQCLQTVLGLPDETAQPLPPALLALQGEALDEIADALEAQRFAPLMDTEELAGHRCPRSDLWSQGFLEAVRLTGPAWEAYTEVEPALGKLLLLLNVVAWPERYAAALFEDPDPEDPLFVLRLRELAQPTVAELISHLDALNEMDQDPPPQEPEPLPGELEDMAPARLMALMAEMGEQLPRRVVEVCGVRGDEMLPLLRDFLSDPAHWEPDVSDQTFWGLAHAVFALGAMDGEAAADALLSVMARLDDEADHELSEWLSGYWPALFRNKRRHAEAGLRRLAEDDSRSSYCRLDAIECLMEGASAQGDGVLEETLDWIAEIAADQSQEADMRYQGAHMLLDFPRPRHRLLLEALARQQLADLGSAHYFSQRDIEAAYSEGDSPTWSQFADPWQFYGKGPQAGPPPSSLYGH